jgi:tol-pal system protein YbgF
MRDGAGCRRVLGFIGGLWLMMAASCTHTDATARTLEDLRADITRVAADRDRLEERVAALERAEQKRSDADSPQAAPVAMVDSPRPTDGTRPPGARAASPDARPADVDGARATKGASDAKRDFDAAIGLMRAKQYDKAVDGLTAFLVRYPDHEYVDQAMFFRGDCLYEKGAPGRAADQLAGLIARFPLSSKAPDAMLKLGLAQQRLGAEDQALRTFAELKQRYPKSDAARQVPRP